ncbi:MAG: hypothetical protein RL037_1335 [Bacteroidota bacterium]|jgi:hypothetical protein
MKKILFSVFALISSVGMSQDCAKIFISEYVEGWGNNKAIEIYNPTASSINLGEYFVARYSNGSTTATVANSVQLSGTIQPYSVFVAVLDKRDENGTGQEAPIWDSLEVRGDGFFSPVYNTSNAFYWNGNDAVMLAKGTLPSDPAVLVNATNVSNFSIIDVFGKIGENPANETGSSAGNDGAWSTQFPYSTGLGVLVTKDHSMIRKANIKKGAITNPSFFDPLLEWDTIPAVVVRLDANGDTLFGTSGNPILDGNWFSLGEHDCGCNPVSVDEMENFQFSVYPNPSTDWVTVNLHGKVVSASLVDAFGKSVGQYRNLSSKMQLQLNVENLTGIYLLHVQTLDGKFHTKKIIIR